MVGLHQILTSNVTHNYLYIPGTSTKLSMLFQVLGLQLHVHLKVLLGLDLTVTEINIKKCELKA